ncbi:Lrp/AsnC family transcriptional regulator [uncultured Paracoccus sp.]|uniref:Lrp/AsnC family transcriptional regulator n=1 Tax=uncultured Paracoccus sp. TaxID=189685 RepID=UPI002609B800|nr:Lrp/AsnC family transcriptional regulator [uncultured Paracoccus sp.]
MSETDRISDLDRRMLAILQRDASGSVADLAKATNSSSATCWRRLRALEDAGVIGPPVRLVNPEAVGRGMDVFCQIRLKAQSTAARDSFQRAMELIPAVVAIYSISGDWDYLLHLLVRDMADLEGTLMQQMLDHENVAASSTIFALRRLKRTTEVPL